MLSFGITVTYSRMSLPVIFKYSRIAIFAASSVGSTVEDHHTSDKRANAEYETDFFQHKN